MINRILIRIIVVQVLYSHLINKDDTLETTKARLKDSLDKAYELYYYLLTLPIELTKLQECRIEAAKGKYMPSEEEMNPNMRFVDNSFVNSLMLSQPLQEMVKAFSLTWNEDEVYLRLILDKILKSDIYEEYMTKESVSDNDDIEFWRQVMKKVVLPDEDLAELLESKSVYWNDDIDIVGTFVVKTIKRFASDHEMPFLPQFKDEEDAQFAELLFVNAVKNKERYMELIDKFVKKSSWDTERLAFMDVVILYVALAELEKVPSVPAVVTINEFVEMAKCYSTPNSGQFINGILYSIIKHLKNEGLLNKSLD